MVCLSVRIVVAHHTTTFRLSYPRYTHRQAAPKNKGKISRVLAAKTALAIRVDAMGDNDGKQILLLAVDGISINQI